MHRCSAWVNKYNRIVNCSFKALVVMSDSQTSSWVAVAVASVESVSDTMAGLYSVLLYSTMCRCQPTVSVYSMLILIHSSTPSLDCCTWSGLRETSAFIITSALFPADMQHMVYYTESSCMVTWIILLSGSASASHRLLQLTRRVYFTPRFCVLSSLFTIDLYECWKVLRTFGNASKEMFA